MTDSRRFCRTIAIIDRGAACLIGAADKTACQIVTGATGSPDAGRSHRAIVRQIPARLVGAPAGVSHNASTRDAKI